MSKERLLIVGAGGFGRVTAEHAQIEYECSFIDDGIAKDALVCGIPVVGNTSDLDKLFGEYYNLIIAIGNNKLRERIYYQAAKIGYIFPNIVDSSAYISPYATIGTGCVILNNVVIQNGANIGNGVILNPGVEIHNDSYVGNNVLIYTNSVIRTLAKVGDRAHIGSTLTIGNEVKIESDQVVDDGHSISI